LNGLKEVIGSEFLGTEWLASCLRTRQTTERLTTCFYGATKSTPFAIVTNRILELPDKAGLAEVVKTRQRRGVLRNLATDDALETVK